MMADIGETLKVTGRSKDMVATGPRPGRTPTTVPNKTPTKAKNRWFG